jgi:hypothetical protein
MLVKFQQIVNEEKGLTILFGKISIQHKTNERSNCDPFSRLP